MVDQPFEILVRSSSKKLAKHNALIMLSNLTRFPGLEDDHIKAIGKALVCKPFKLASGFFECVPTKSARKRMRKIVSGTL